jgi:class 3 adenylate cyclase/tetratricopeptide (TPR) repeat protein
MRTCPHCGNGLDDAAKFCQECGTRLGPRRTAQEFRIVTVVFGDVVNSTELQRKLDRQPMQQLLDRFNEIVRQVLGGHGASIGKRQGDGFMAAFGAHRLREDDALRAVLAVSELRTALAALAEELRRERGLDFIVRLGINTGDVLVRDAATLDEELTGEAINLAKRLEEAAGPGEILLGDETHELVADVVKAEPAEPLTLDGFEGPQAVWRLLQVLPERPLRAPRSTAPMVGRQLELGMLSHWFQRVDIERTCHLVTVLGSAGVGKSRLVDEFVATLQARILRAHCLAVGDSVTLWPMIEIMRQAAGIDPNDPPARTRERLAELMRGQDRGDLVVERVAQLLGFGKEELPAEKEPPDEEELPEGTYWAPQQLLEALARRRPLVLVIDDLQWADPILMDAVEYIAERTDAPLLLLCMARPDELFLRREHWPGGRRNAASVELYPLSDRDGELLVDHLLGGTVGPEVQAHITEWAHGFPLLVEELVTNLREEGRLESRNGRWVLRREPEEVADREVRPAPVPISVQHLLQARLDRLGPRGKMVVEPAAVVGQQFHVGDVKALLPDTSVADLDAGLQELVRLDLIRTDHGRALVPLPPDIGTGYQFRHATIKTVAYERLADDRRAELHERYADWLESQTLDRRSQFDELIGYHFLKSFQYASKLGPKSDRTRDLARRAGERYAAAGQRAAIRGDNRVVQAWLGLAVDLLPADNQIRLKALPPLAEALQTVGQLTEAESAWQKLASSASALGDEGVAMHARLGRLQVTAQHNPEEFLARRNRIELAISTFERLQDSLGLAKAWHLLAYFDWMRGRLSLAEVSVDQARVFAKEAGDQTWEGTILSLYCLIQYWGMTPLETVDERVGKVLALARENDMRSLEATALTVLARSIAMRGDLKRAKELMNSAEDITGDPAQGGLLTQAAQDISRALVDLLDGRPRDAEDVLRGGLSKLERMRGDGPRANVAIMLARVKLVQELDDEAEELTRTCERIAGTDQVDVQVRWRSIRAVVRARRGELEDAERLAKQAVYMAGQTDQPASRAEAHVDLAEVLRLGGRHGEATGELELAAGLYAKKGFQLALRDVHRLLGRRYR